VTASVLDGDLEVRDRTDTDRWAGVEVRGYCTPDVEILPRSKGGDGRTVTGILVPYGKRQVIHEGLEEMVRRGAAAHQIRSANRMKFAREHLKFGGALIGRATELRDDAAGMWGALWAVPGVQAADETLALIEAGALDQLSIGFRARQTKRHPDGLQERVKIDILETAAVLEGAYGSGARVTGLRSAGAHEDDMGPGEYVEEDDEHERSAVDQPATMSTGYLDLLVARNRIVISNGMIR
jgi:hypothetical protein